MGLTWGSTEQSLYAFFKGKGLSDNGIFGLFGNLYAESAMNPKNLQNSYESKLGFTDDTYTAAVDSGAYSNFVKDSAGYGLAQWTYWSRKQAMLAYHQAAGVSIGDLMTQAGFLYKELSESYAGVLATLETASSIREASDAVLLKFERPADTGASVQEKRASYGQQYEALYKKQTGGNKEMAYSRSVVVNILLSWKDAKEGSARHKEIIDLYNTLSPLPRGYKVTYTDAWCAATWSAAAAKAGYTAIMPVECSCYYLIEAAKEMGIWQENDAYIPDPGDAVLYDWDDGVNYATTDNTGAPEHVGGVWKVEGNTIYVIEGNKNDAVGVRELKVNGRYIRGFICPKYTEEGSSSAGSSTGSGSSTSGTSLNRTEKWKGVTTTGLNVRKWAGTEYDTCSFSPLKEGEEISICDETKAADGSKWYYIKNKAGKHGFVFAKYVVSVGSSASKTYDVGDKVKVTGTIYGNGTGTGGSIKKNGATMYVVGLANSGMYKHYIGLATTKGGVRQGWAEPSILTKLG